MTNQEINEIRSNMLQKLSMDYHGVEFHKLHSMQRKQIAKWAAIKLNKLGVAHPRNVRWTCNNVIVSF